MTDILIIIIQEKTFTTCSIPIDYIQNGLSVVFLQIFFFSLDACTNVAVYQLNFDKFIGEYWFRISFFFQSAMKNLVIEKGQEQE